MIDFRYHIVSLIAVFLALGVGILVGSTVLATGTVSVLQAQTNALDSQLADSNRRQAELEDTRDLLRALADQSGPYAIRDRLAGRRFLTVSDGGAGGWRDKVRDGLLQAGAQQTGSILLTDRFKLSEAGAADQLTAMVREVLPAFQPGERPAEDALTVLGSSVFAADGRLLLRRLSDAGYLSVSGADLRDGTWPDAGTDVLAFASPYGRNGPEAGWLSSFARAVARSAPTLVVSASPGASAVAVLRDGEVPATLSTFDSGALEPADRIVGSLALAAAVQGRGGHFGAEQGRRLLPEPA